MARSLRLSAESESAPSHVTVGKDAVGSTTTSAIAVRGVTKHFRRQSGSTAIAVDDLSLDAAAGEIVAVVGPSGCGKTTLLRCVAGLERPSGGDIYLGGRLVSGGGNRGTFVPPERRGIGMMFQSYALWPHMTVAENVGYPLRCRGVPKKQRQGPVDSILLKLGLDGLQNEPPSRLSGGQQQRVALARSLVAEPGVVLFDEPLSNVDAKVREELRLELVRMHKEIGFSGLYVTHDQDDALQVCDRIIVLKDGKVEQAGAPADVYRDPSSVYVAEFVGIVNRLPGRIVEGMQGQHVLVETDLGLIAATEARTTSGTGNVSVLIRPHHVNLSHGLSADGENNWAGTIGVRMFRGAWMQYLVTVGDTLLQVWSPDHSYEEGTQVTINIAPADVFVRAGDRR